MPMKPYSEDLNLFIFTDPTCGPCNALLLEIARWQDEYTEDLTIALISRGYLEENRTKTSEHGGGNVLLQEDWEEAEAYKVGARRARYSPCPMGRSAAPLLVVPMLLGA